MASQVLCRHCNSPVPEQRDDGFCCTGCQFVYDLLLKEGLDHFYDLKGSLALPPVSPQSLRERDYDWLEQLGRKEEIQVSSEGKGGLAEMRLSLQGISCVGCVWLIEKVFARHPGGVRVNVDLMQGEAVLVYSPGRFEPVAFARDLQAFGYLLGPPQSGEGKKPASGLERRMGLCGAFAMNAMAFSLPAYFGMPGTFFFAPWFDMIAAVSATLAMLVGGSYFIEKAWRSLRLGVLHIDTPIALGIIAAYGGSLGGWMLGEEGLKYFDFVAIFIFLMLVGRWAQQAAVDRNRRKLMRDSSIPEQVTVPGEENPVALDTLKPGVSFVVKPGQAVPVACRLLSPEAAVSLEWINGESEARRHLGGQMLPAGAMNIGSHSLMVEGLEAWSKSALRKLLEARRPGEYRDLRLERLLRIYLLVVVIIGLAGALGWWWSGQGVVAALQVMISIFVVSCPCALGVAVPLAEELAASRAEKLGVFVRNLGLWKRLMRTRRVVFDKTGTLTLENPSLENPEALRDLDVYARKALRTLVTGNLHPVSRSLFDALGPGESLMAEAGVEEKIGQGIYWRDTAGNEWSLSRGTESDAQFACNGKRLAGLFFRDELRRESVDEVRELKRRGLEVAVLSGDRAGKVERIAARLGLEQSHWQAAMTPEQKAGWVAARDQDDTLYIGDGANDSLAFDAALCTGSPAGGRSFLEQKADFFFLGHSLRFVSGLLDVARLHRRATRRVFGFSVTYNIVTVAAGLAGHLSPLAAAILMPLSSVVTLSLVAVTFGRSKHGRETNSLHAQPASSREVPA
ncbi:MAG TPA: heavy metal translocating P-type ATPase metal-binding domain-containing protein [Prosthecobacter sp.]